MWFIFNGRFLSALFVFILDHNPDVWIGWNCQSYIWVLIELSPKGKRETGFGDLWGNSSTFRTPLPGVPKLPPWYQSCPTTTLCFCAHKKPGQWEKSSKRDKSENVLMNCNNLVTLQSVLYAAGLQLDFFTTSYRIFETRLAYFIGDLMQKINKYKNRETAPGKINGCQFFYVAIQPYFLLWSQVFPM